MTRRRIPRARWCGPEVAVVVMWIIWLSECHCYQLHTVWYPNASDVPSPASTCPLLSPGSDAVDLDFHYDDDNLAGAALYLHAGQYATAASPVIDDTDNVGAVCWVMLVRGSGAGTVAEFEFSDGQTLEAELDYSREEIRTYYVKGGEKTDTETYQPEPDTAWQTVAYGFRVHPAKMMVWMGGEGNKRFQAESVDHNGNLFYPESVRLGYTPSRGHSSSNMAVTCLMLLSFPQYDDLRWLTQQQMADLLGHCSDVSNNDVLGCVDGMERDQTSPQAPTTTSTQPPSPSPSTTAEATTTSGSPGLGATEKGTTDTTAPSPTAAATTTASLVTTSHDSSGSTTGNYTTPADTQTTLTPSSDQDNRSTSALQSDCRCSVQTTAASASSSAKVASKYSQHLMLDAARLSSARRRKESAADDRTTAVAAGYVGVAVFTLVGCFIVGLDVVPLVYAKLRTTCSV